MRVLIMFCVLIISGCTAQQNVADPKTPKPPSTLKAEAKTVEEKASDRKPGEVDFSCKTASDCKIKDVGSCCGYRPACVNKDSETFPEQVKAECAKNEMSGICGFPTINSCACNNNKCEGSTDGPGEVVTQ